jgi:hypothetical protein
MSNDKISQPLPKGKIEMEDEEESETDKETISELESQPPWKKLKTEIYP